MVGLIIAVSVVGLFSVAATIVFALQLKKLRKQLGVVAKCLHTYILHPEMVEIIDDNTTLDDYTINFPNSEGF